MSELLPAPNLLGAPDRFKSWNPDQAEALLCAIDSPKRFVGLVLPTGSGKTLVSVMAHILTGKRTAILTSTKALQDQIIRDFHSIGIKTAMGQSAYECLAVRPGGELHGSVESPATCDRGPCRARVTCSMKESGCLYYDALRTAKMAPLLVTNYAYWMTQYRHGQGLGQFDVLILDEAHAVPDELAGFLNTELRHSDVKNALNTTLPPAPSPSTPMCDQIAAWTTWAKIHAQRLGRALEEGKPVDGEENGVAGAAVTSRDIGRLIRLTHLHRTLELIAKMDPEMWIVHGEIDRTVFDPVWVAGYAENTLFRNIPKIVLMSATFRPKTAELIGLDKADVEMYEARSGFDRRRRPVYVCTNAPRVDHRMDESGFNKWRALIDNILDARKDRKGIIHTISYKRRNQIVQSSRHRDRMLSHDRENTRQVIEQFKTAPAGTILVSPSVTTGYDFPFEECEFQIICKVPFPDSRDPILAARTAEDRDYGAYMAMQELVQAVGRGMRAPTDSCETFLVDAHGIWFLSKYRDLAPKWFHEAVTRIDVLPSPLPKLGESNAEVA